MPRRHHLGRAALGLVIVMLPTLALAGVRVLPGKEDPVARRSDGFHLPSPVPCEQAVQDLDLTVSLQQAFTDSTEGESAVDSYACNPGWAMTGPEHVYILTATVDLIVDLGLASNVPIDHDLVLLSACDSDSCLVQANTELSAQLTAGTTVYLVVDGFHGDAGEYTLLLETRPIGIPDAICNGGAVPIAIPLEDTSEALVDTLFGRPNLVSLYDCAPYTVRGGEIWYAMTIAAADTDTVGTGHGEYSEVTITATTGVLGLDLALWVFADCGPAAECLAFVDDAVGGGQEVLVWDNQIPELSTIYLAVDCIASPADTASGIYTLDFDTQVPVETRRLSSLRNRFR